MGAREAGAFARQALLLPRDALAPVLPAEVADGDHVVVFLHGLLATAGVLRPLRQRIERHPRIRTAALSYPPGPGVLSIERRLASVLDALPPDCYVHLVGHSLGGIVARHYAVTQDDPRIASTLALATPFGGIPAAKLLGFEWARDLDPDGPVLRRVRLTTPARSIPHLSLVAGADVLASTPVAHALPYGDQLVIDGIGHNTILFDRDAMDHVERRILMMSAEPARAGSSPVVACSEPSQTDPQTRSVDNRPSGWP